MSKEKTAEQLEKKRQNEKDMVGLMIEIYCHGKHGTKKHELCSDCLELRDYAFLRSDKCPFMKTKTFCSNCKVHCYKPEMRTKIREVMRYSGPRMLFHRPIAACRHVISTMVEKRRLAKG